MTTPVHGTRTFPLSEGQKRGELILRNETGSTISDYKIHVNSDDFTQPGFLYIKIRKTKDEQGRSISELINSAGNPNNDTENYGSTFHRNIPTNKQIKPGEEITIEWILTKGADEPAHIQISFSKLNEEGKHIWIVGGTDVPHTDITVIDKVMEIIEIIKGIYSLISPLISMASSKDQAIMTSLATIIAMNMLPNNGFQKISNVNNNVENLDNDDNAKTQTTDNTELATLVTKLASDPKMAKIIQEFSKSQKS